MNMLLIQSTSTPNKQEAYIKTTLTIMYPMSIANPSLLPLIYYPCALNRRDNTPSGHQVLLFGLLLIGA